MKSAIQFALRGYKRWISPMLPHACRFVPTCSEYAIEAVERHGALRGSWLAARDCYAVIPSAARDTILCRGSQFAASLILQCCRSIAGAASRRPEVSRTDSRAHADGVEK